MTKRISPSPFGEGRPRLCRGTIKLDKFHSAITVGPNFARPDVDLT
jgi:hypothetical protein